MAGDGEQLASEREHLTAPATASQPEASSRSRSREARMFEAVTANEQDGDVETFSTLHGRRQRMMLGVAGVLVLTCSVAYAAVFSNIQGTAPARAAEDVRFHRHSGYDCWLGFGGDPLRGNAPLEAVNFYECERDCLETQGCTGFVFPNGAPRGICVLHRRMDLEHCLRTPAVDVWMRGGVAINVAVPKERSSAPVTGRGDAAWFERAAMISALPGYRCEAGGEPVPSESLQQCQDLCERNRGCGGVSFCFSARRCHFHMTLSIEECQLHEDWDSWLKPSLHSAPTPDRSAIPPPKSPTSTTEPLTAAPTTTAVPTTREPTTTSTHAQTTSTVRTTLAPTTTSVTSTTRATTAAPTTTRAPTTTTEAPTTRAPTSTAGASSTWMSADEWKDYEQAVEADVQGAEKQGYYRLRGYDCWSPSASEPVPGMVGTLDKATLCAQTCNQYLECDGFIFGHSVHNGSCWLRRYTRVPNCTMPALGEALDYDFFMRASRKEWTPYPMEVAPLHEFYMYRAAAPGVLNKYPFGQVNLANMEGVMWYLMNEIVTNYTQGPRCPRRFGIAMIHRFKIKTRATPAMAKIKMNFGTRFAYDQGMCTGRCFPGNLCTGSGDCMTQFDKYGFVPGCNKFESNYPFPVDANSAPGGVWYSLPLDGRCDGDPTGDDRCTWSYEYAGYITLADLEELSPGQDNCCNGRCSDFWHNQWDPVVMSWRVGAALWVFKSKYPAWSKNLLPPVCDFDREKWYAEDPWPRQDPWR